MAALPCLATVQRPDRFTVLAVPRYFVGTWDMDRDGIFLPYLLACLALARPTYTTHRRSRVSTTQARDPTLARPVDKSVDRAQCRRLPIIRSLRVENADKRPKQVLRQHVVANLAGSHGALSKRRIAPTIRSEE